MGSSLSMAFVPTVNVWRIKCCSSLSKRCSHANCMCRGRWNGAGMRMLSLDVEACATKRACVGAGFIGHLLVPTGQKRHFLVYFEQRAPAGHVRNGSRSVVTTFIKLMKPA